MAMPLTAQEAAQSGEGLTKKWARTRSLRVESQERITSASAGIVQRWNLNGEVGKTRGIARGIKVEPVAGQPNLSNVSISVDSSSGVAFENILFKIDSTELADDASLAQIKAIATAMKNLPSERFLIEGHTCDLGSDEHNKTLSEIRAEAVCKSLVQLGVEMGQLFPLGFGETNPKLPNADENARCKNRRVMVFRRN